MAKATYRSPNDDKNAPLSRRSFDRSYGEACRLYNEGEDEKAILLLNQLLQKGDLSGNAVSLLDEILRPYGRIPELSAAYQTQIEWLNAAIQSGWPEGYEPFEHQQSRHRNVIRLLTQDQRPLTLLDYDQPAIRCQNAWLFRGRFNLGATRVSTAPDCIRLSFIETGDLSECEQAEIRQVVFRRFADRTASFVSRVIREIHIFRFAMQLGDPVIAFDAKLDAWDIGEVLGAYDWDASSSPPFAHTRSVRWTDHIPHYDLPSPTRDRLRRLRTVQDIPSDLWKSIRSLCSTDGQRKAATNVPVWSHHAQSRNAPANERELFKAKFAEAVARGTFLDVNGQVAYVWDYLQDQLRLLRKGRDPGPIVSLFTELRSAYGSEPSLIEFLDWQLSELFLYLGDFETAWKYLRRRRVDANGVLNVRAKCKCQTLDANDLLNVPRVKEYLTDWGRANLEEIDLV